VFVDLIEIGFLAIVSSAFAINSNDFSSIKSAFKKEQIA
jgi:hypothetical protein